VQVGRGARGACPVRVRMLLRGVDVPAIKTVMTKNRCPLRSTPPLGIPVHFLKGQPGVLPAALVRPSVLAIQRTHT